MQEIRLTQGKVTLVSDHRFEYLNQWKWCAAQRNGIWYAQRTEYFPVKKNIQLHRLIMGFPKGMDVDHWDGDGLHNWDENLRICTRSQNIMNMHKRLKSVSGFKGVAKNWKGWKARIGVNGILVNLGTYATPEEAALVYDIAARKYFGEFAALNFP